MWNWDDLLKGSGSRGSKSGGDDEVNEETGEVVGGEGKSYSEPMSRELWNTMWDAPHSEDSGGHMVTLNIRITAEMKEQMHNLVQVMKEQGVPIENMSVLARGLIQFGMKAYVATERDPDTRIASWVRERRSIGEAARLSYELDSANRECGALLKALNSLLEVDAVEDARDHLIENLGLITGLRETNPALHTVMLRVLFRSSMFVSCVERIEKECGKSGVVDYARRQYEVLEESRGSRESRESKE